MHRYPGKGSVFDQSSNATPQQPARVSIQMCDLLQIIIIIIPAVIAHKNSTIILCVIGKRGSHTATWEYLSTPGQFKSIPQQWFPHIIQPWLLTPIFSQRFFLMTFITLDASFQDHSHLNVSEGQFLTGSKLLATWHDSRSGGKLNELTRSKSINSYLLPPEMAS